MIKGKWIVIILIVLLLLFNGVRFYSSYKEKQVIKDDTLYHLKENGYEDADIYETDVVNVGGNKLKYAVVVTFNDEKNVNYLYTYNKGSEKIMQIDAVDKEHNGDFDHLE